MNKNIHRHSMELSLSHLIDPIICHNIFMLRCYRNTIYLHISRMSCLYRKGLVLTIRISFSMAISCENLARISAFNLLSMMISCKNLARISASTFNFLSLMISCKDFTLTLFDFGLCLMPEQVSKSTNILTKIWILNSFDLWGIFYIYSLLCHCSL